MSFFSTLFTPQPYRVGEKNFDRARRAEVRREFDKAQARFMDAAQGFDDHLARWKAEGKEVKPSHLIMAGISYVRIGRNEDALAVLKKALEYREIPDGFLHAGYAAAKLGDAGLAEKLWSQYPDWASQHQVAKALKAAVETLRESDDPDLKTLCEAVAKAAHQQDMENEKFRNTAPRWQEYLKNRRY